MAHALPLLATLRTPSARGRCYGRGCAVRARLRLRVDVCAFVLSRRVLPLRLLRVERLYGQPAPRAAAVGLRVVERVAAREAAAGSTRRLVRALGGRHGVL